MRKILITGGSHSELPLIEAAQKMGWYVISTGNNEGDIGHITANKHIIGDFSDKEYVYELAKSEKVDAIVSGANDFAYLSTAYACEKLGLPGHDNYETSRKIHIKNMFREMTGNLGIKAPRIRKCYNENDLREAAREVGFPLMVKPVDLTGGKGVKSCSDLKDSIDAFYEAMRVTREKYIIVEEFIKGSPHGITCLLKNKRIVWYIIDNEQYGLNKYLVLGASSPSDIPHYSEFSLIRDIEKIAKYCDLVDGLFHTQFIIDKDNYPIIIDPCRRAPGDLYVLLAKYVTGVDYPSEIVNVESGGTVKDYYISQHNFAARECIMTSQKGIIKEVHIEDELQQYIVYRFMRDNKGVIIDQPMKYKAGILIMQFDNYDEMSNILKKFDKLAWIEFEEG